jgi:hypothetical protein
METRLREHEILDVIDILSSLHESGRLQITTGMTEGAIFFDKGELVDARLGKLTGFQAINAVASIPDATFSFDPSAAPPVRSLITPNERRLLKDFFGIGGVQHKLEEPDVIGPDHSAPAQVVPLSEVEDRESSSVVHAQSMPATPHFVDEEASARPPTFTEADAGDDEVTLVGSNAPHREYRPAIAYASISKPGFRPKLLIAVLMILCAAVTFSIVYRFRTRNSPAPATVQTSSAADVPPVTNGGPAPAEVAAGAPNLSGNWKVTNTVEQTSYQAFKNLEVGFDLAINQNGNEFTGRGQKVSENGRSLPATSRTPILVKGSINGDRVEATFSESGALRQTSGRFVWRIDKASGALTGTFVSSAARTSGKSAARKQS